MHRFARYSLLVAVLSISAAACSGNDAIDTPTAPTSPTTTDSFSGVLTLNGAATYHFTITGTGAVTAQLKSLRPDPVKPIGFSLGSWSGAVCQVSPGLYNDLAIEGSAIVAETQTVGEFCVRVYDAAGTTVDPQTYTVEVTHP
jgi:hypothetical protein